MLRIRQELGKTSVKKYQAMSQAVCPDGRLRGVLQFYGANRTGRWAGRIVQVHNLPQNKIPDLDLARQLVKDEDFETLELLFEGVPFVFSQLIRTTFVPSPGCRFVVSDFSAIEARVTAWLADEQWRLDVFNGHGKIYEASAAQMFHVPIESVKKGSKLRQQGKVAELALGYGGGFGAMKKMDKAGTIPDDEIPMIISNWRKASPRICKFWYNVEGAAKTAMEERRTVKLKHGITFSYINHILFIGLPSGRKLAYYNARIEDGKKGKPAITYEGVDQETKAWGRNETWGGKLVENIVQAVARDCLAETIKRVSSAGYQIVMHVHDEIIVDVPKADTSALKTITDIMAQPISWAPGCPCGGTVMKPTITERIDGRRIMNKVAAIEDYKLNIHYDGPLSVSTGKSRFEKHWKNREMQWSALLKRLQAPTRTQETLAEYKAMSKTQQDQIKDVGGFVGGSLKDGRRKSENVMMRQLVTLDADFGTGRFG